MFASKQNQRAAMYTFAKGFRYKTKAIRSVVRLSPAMPFLFSERSCLQEMELK